ncbi:MAG: hypothetical protein JRN52_05065 [Nitrososphaerota archaeon]|nr:hypothetical protein [Nitrososphaerota archaeon]
MAYGQIISHVLLDVSFPNFVPVHIIEIGGLIVFVCVVLGVLYKITRWHNSSIPKNLVKRIREVITLPSIITTAAGSLKEDAVLIKPLYAKSKSRWLTHATMMWGFVGLALTTTFAYIFNPSGEPMPFTWPVRILGNVSGAMLIVGCAIFAYRLMTNPAERNPLTFRADVVFFSALFLTVITGFATEFFGYGQDLFGAYTIYALHLVLVTLLLGSAPFTRFLHAIMTPYFAIFEKLRMKATGLSQGGMDSKFKERRIAEFVAENFYGLPLEDKQEKPT